MAVCVSKVNSYQNKYFFYDNSSQTERYAGKTFQIPKTLVRARKQWAELVPHCL